MRAQTGTEMIVLIAVSLFFVVTFALLFTDFTVGIDSDAQYVDSQVLARLSVGILDYGVSQNCSYIQLQNNLEEDITITAVLINNNSLNTSLLPVTLDKYEQTELLGCGLNKWGEDDYFSYPVLINYSILDRERTQERDDVYLVGDRLSDSGLTSAQLALLPIGISDVVVSESCTQFLMKNNMFGNVTIYSVELNRTTIQTTNFPLTLTRSNSSAVLTCDILPELDESINYPVVVNYSLNGENFTQDYDSFIRTTSVELSASFSPTDSLYSDKLLAFWKFENDTRDYANNYVSGSLYGDPQVVTGVDGFAYTFDGTGDYIDTLVNESVSDGDFSVSVWLNGTTTSIYAVSQMYQQSGYSSDWIVGGNTYDFWMRSQTVGSSSVYDGIWHHLVMVYDASVNKYEGFIDGELIGQSGSIGAHGGIASIKIASRGDGTTSYFTGTLDEIAIWNRTLHPIEIKSLFLRGNYSLN